MNASIKHLRNKYLKELADEINEARMNRENVKMWNRTMETNNQSKLLRAKWTFALETLETCFPICFSVLFFVFVSFDLYLKLSCTFLLFFYCLYRLYYSLLRNSWL